MSARVLRGRSRRSSPGLESSPRYVPYTRTLILIQLTIVRLVFFFATATEKKNLHPHGQEILDLKRKVIVPGSLDGTKPVQLMRLCDLPGFRIQAMSPGLLAKLGGDCQLRISRGPHRTL